MDNQNTQMKPIKAITDMKPTKQQLILFNILSEFPDGVALGELRCLFYQIHKPRKNGRFYCEMKRNSRMSSWLNSLNEKGLIYINRGESNLYSLTDKSKDLLK